MRSKGMGKQMVTRKRTKAEQTKARKKKLENQRPNRNQKHLNDI